ncbi:MAG: hypothetical protein JNJ55_00690, partial [Betaproteobacteria bacterium]|nr:hypothetical protein [Betaproteobacteria bacterium]
MSVKSRLKCYSAVAIPALSNFKQLTMMNERKFLPRQLLRAFGLIYAAMAVPASAQTLFDLGTCPLESSQRIEACK